MAHASLSTRLLALAASVSFSASAAADDRAGASAGGASISEPEAGERWVEAIPARCAPFAAALTSPAGRPATEDGWRQLLSLASCVQDGSIAEATDPGELEAMVEAMAKGLALPMLIYLEALEHGGGRIQLRAAFQIGMAYLAFSTRARSAIAAPPDLATSAEAASRYRELHARLEPLLVPARRAAWISFQAIDEAAAEHGDLAGDQTERNMIRTAREMLPLLRDAAPEQHMLARPAAFPAGPVSAAAP